MPVPHGTRKQAKNLECGGKSRAVRGSRHRFCAPPRHRTPVQKAASRGIPLAAALVSKFLPRCTHHNDVNYVNDV